MEPSPQRCSLHLHCATSCGRHRDGRMTLGFLIAPNVAGETPAPPEHQASPCSSPAARITRDNLMAADEPTPTPILQENPERLQPANRDLRQRMAPSPCSGSQDHGVLEHGQRQNCGNRLLAQARRLCHRITILNSHRSRDSRDFTPRVGGHHRAARDRSHRRVCEGCRGVAARDRALAQRDEPRRHRAVVLRQRPGRAHDRWLIVRAFVRASRSTAVVAMRPHLVPRIVRMPWQAPSVVRLTTSAVAPPPGET